MRTAHLLATALTFALAHVLRAQTVSQVWVTRYDSPAHLSDEAKAVVVDGSGNVIVTGTSDAGWSPFAGGIGLNIYTAKYAAADGALLWYQVYASGINDYVNAAAVDAAGNMIITGRSDNYAGTYSGRYTAKYAAALT